MKPHQERVVQEKEELDQKRSKLDLFFKSATFDTVSGEEQALLRYQAEVMAHYSHLLAKRIELFKE